MTQCFVSCNWKKTILIRDAEGKEMVFCILHMLSIHTGLRTRHKRNLFELFFLIHLIFVYRALRLQRVNFYLNNI